MEHLGHFDGIVPSLVCILTKQHGVHGGKCLLKTPENAISVTQNFKMSVAASALKNLCLWCKFQSSLLFIISLLLKNFLTALVNLSFHTGLSKNMYILLFCFWLMLCFLSDQNFAGDRCDTLNRLQALNCQGLSNPSSKGTPTQVLTCC